MIEINLLPTSGKKKSRTGKTGGGGGGGGGGPKKSLNIGAAFSRFVAQITDPWLITAALSVVVAVLAVGGAYTYQSSRVSSLLDEETKALADSTRFAVVTRDRIRAEAKRDTLLRQLNIIRSIDEDRFIWPHVLDEVSKALPPYTWLTTLNFTGTPQGSVNVAATKAEAAPAGNDAAAKKVAASKAKRLDTVVPRDEVKVRLLGQTVDIQALTRFMKQLEASPFLGDVQLNRSELVMDQGKEVTQFTLDVTYTRPDTSLIRRVPLSASVR